MKVTFQLMSSPPTNRPCRVVTLPVCFQPLQVTTVFPMLISKDQGRSTQSLKWLGMNLKTVPSPTTPC